MNAQEIEQAFEKQRQALQRAADAMQGVSLALGKQKKAADDWYQVNESLSEETRKLGTNYRVFGDEMGCVGDGVRQIGDKARELFRIMDDFDSGKTRSLVGSVRVA